MIFRQLFDSESSTYSYILGDEQSGDAVIIDPVLERSARDLKRIQELGLNLKFILETHVHADHITGADELRRLLGAKTVMARDSGVDCADLKVQDGDEIIFGAYRIQVIATPGHTHGCLSYYVRDRVFTGDCLMIRTAGRTDFQQGSPELAFESIMSRLYKLPDTTFVYPGHDYAGNTVSTIGEEKLWNLRIPVTQTLEGFVKLMRELKLPEPKRIHEALPANLECGRSRPGK